MGFFSRTKLADSLDLATPEVGLEVRDADDSETAPNPLPSRGSFGVDGALTISAAYRAIQILCNAVTALDLQVLRSGQPIPSPNFVLAPESGASFRLTIRRIIQSLYVAGECFVMVYPNATATGPLMLQVLNPQWCSPFWQNGSGPLVVDYHGLAGPVQQYSTDLTALRAGERVIVQIKLFDRPGHLHGLGPIQAASRELRGIRDLQEYASCWFDLSGIPTGILTSDQELTPTQASDAKASWLKGLRTRTVAVLGKGLTYQTTTLNPSDALFSEQQQHAVTTVARLFGVPVHLLGAAVDGGSDLTYTNVQQARSEFLTFTSDARDAIEDLFTSLLPRGQSAKFNTDGMLRADPAGRAAYYTAGITGQWLTVAEIRELENLSALDPSTDPNALDA